MVAIRKHYESSSGQSTPVLSPLGGVILALIMIVLMLIVYWSYIWIRKGWVRAKRGVEYLVVKDGSFRIFSTGIFYASVPGSFALKHRTSAGGEYVVWYDNLEAQLVEVPGSAPYPQPSTAPPPPPPQSHTQPPQLENKESYELEDFGVDLDSSSPSTHPPGFSSLYLPDNLSVEDGATQVFFHASNRSSSVLDHALLDSPRSSLETIKPVRKSTGI